MLKILKPPYLNAIRAGTYFVPIKNQLFSPIPRKSRAIIPVNSGFGILPFERADPQVHCIDLSTPLAPQTGDEIGPAVGVNQHTGQNRPSADRMPKTVKPTP